MKLEQLKLGYYFTFKNKPDDYIEKVWQLVFIDENENNFYFFKKGKEDGIINNEWALYHNRNILDILNIEYLEEEDYLSFKDSGVFMFLDYEKIQRYGCELVFKEKIKNLLNR
jgi:hypothetical protein